MLTQSAISFDPCPFFRKGLFFNLPFALLFSKAKNRMSHKYKNKPHTALLFSHFSDQHRPFKTEAFSFYGRGYQTAGPMSENSVTAEFKPRLKTISKYKNKCCLITTTKTNTNIHTNISSLFGTSKTAWTASAGQIKGFKGRKALKKTRFARRILTRMTSDKILSLGFRYLVFHFHGQISSRMPHAIMTALNPKRPKRIKTVLKSYKKQNKSQPNTSSVLASKSKKTVLRLRKRRTHKLILIKGFTQIAHNGCRLPAARRV